MVICQALRIPFNCISIFFSLYSRHQDRYRKIDGKDLGDHQQQQLPYVCPVQLRWRSPFGPLHPTITTSTGYSICATQLLFTFTSYIKGFCPEDLSNNKMVPFTSQIIKIVTSFELLSCVHSSWKIKWLWN